MNICLACKLVISWEIFIYFKVYFCYIITKPLINNLSVIIMSELSSLSVKQFIVDNFLFGDSKKLKEDTQLLDKGIIDSTGVLELVAFIEENFNITVKDDELIQDNFSSLIAIEKFLQSKKSQVASI